MIILDAAGSIESVIRLVPILIRLVEQLGKFGKSIKFNSLYSVNFTKYLDCISFRLRL